MDLRILHNDFMKLFREFTDKKGNEREAEGLQCWRSFKFGGKKKCKYDFEGIQRQMQEWSDIIEDRKNGGFWSVVKAPKHQEAFERDDGSNYEGEGEEVEDPEHPFYGVEKEEMDPYSGVVFEDSSSFSREELREMLLITNEPAPKQAELQKSITNWELELDFLRKVIDPTATQVERETEILSLIEETKKKIKRLQSNQRANQRLRRKRKLDSGDVDPTPLKLKEREKRGDSLISVGEGHSGAFDEDQSSTTTSKMEEDLNETVEYNEEGIINDLYRGNGELPPKQAEIQKMITNWELEMDFLQQLIDPTTAQNARYAELEKLAYEGRKRLKRLQDSQRATKKHRDRERKKRLDAGAILKLGRPTIEESDANLANLQDAIGQCLLQSSSGLSISKLKEKLQTDFGIEVKRSTLHTRIQQMNQNASLNSLSEITVDEMEGSGGTQSQHTTSSTVGSSSNNHSAAVKKFRRAQDSEFTLATIQFMRELAVLMERACFYLVHDDRGRVPLQMESGEHGEQKSKKMLTTSVFAGCIVNDETVTYNGPTYVAIRPEKHGKSTPQSQCAEFRRLLELESFKSAAKMWYNDGGELLKPILLITLNNFAGGSDGENNPASMSSLKTWARIFKLYNLDLVVVATQAPGQQTTPTIFNAIERRMAGPLKELVEKPLSLYMNPDLTSNEAETINREQQSDDEMANFKVAGETLAEILLEWSTEVCPIFAEWVGDSSEAIHPQQRSFEEYSPSEQWIQGHVMQSQYALQIRKCAREACCGAHRTMFASILPNGFLPSPARFMKTERGMEIASLGEEGRFCGLKERMFLDKLVPEGQPFDAFCPSVAEKLNSLTCSNCSAYFPSSRALKNHKNSKVCFNVAGTSSSSSLFPSTSQLINQQLNISSQSSQQPTSSSASVTINSSRGIEVTPSNLHQQIKYLYGGGGYDNNNTNLIHYDMLF